MSAIPEFMKTLFTIFIFVLFFTSMAFSSNVAHYNIREGKLHKGGSARIELIPSSEHFKVKLQYNIHKKALVPVPSSILKGENDLDLPPAFQDERGYLELEVKRKIDLPEAVLNYLGRTKIAGFNDAHKILIKLKDGKGEIETIYHPTLPGIGWSTVKILINANIGIINNYVVIADLKK